MNLNTLVKSHLKKQIALQKTMIKETEKNMIGSKYPDVDLKYLERLKKDLKSFESQLEARTEIL